MHINDIFAEQPLTCSFEFFPPKTEKSAEALYRSIAQLEALKPSFVSVTYGAGGSTREVTNELVLRIKQTTSLDPIPHLTCVCHQENEIAEIIERYAEKKASAIYSHSAAIRPAIRLTGIAAKTPFATRLTLVAFIRKFNESGAHPGQARLRHRRRRLP